MVQHASMQRFVTGYMKLASDCLNDAFNGYAVKPKLHLFKHQVLELHESLSKGDEVLEPSSDHVVTEDSIKRFGGPSAPSAPWPRDNSAEEDEDKLAHLEKKLVKILKSRGKNHRVSRGSVGSGSNNDENSSCLTGMTGLGVSTVEED
eukprot:s3292_g3.t1